jgi:hypothetical protein
MAKNIVFLGDIHSQPIVKPCTQQHNSIQWLGEKFFFCKGGLQFWWKKRFANFFTEFFQKFLFHGMIHNNVVCMVCMCVFIKTPPNPSVPTPHIFFLYFPYLKWDDISKCVCKTNITPYEQVWLTLEHCDIPIKDCMLECIVWNDNTTHCSCIVLPYARVWLTNKYGANTSEINSIPYERVWLMMKTL